MSGISSTPSFGISWLRTGRFPEVRPPAEPPEKAVRPCTAVGNYERDGRSDARDGRYGKSVTARRRAATVRRDHSLGLQTLVRQRTKYPLGQCLRINVLQQFVHQLVRDRQDIPLSGNMARSHKNLDSPRYSSRYVKQVTHVTESCVPPSREPIRPGDSRRRAGVLTRSRARQELAHKSQPPSGRGPRIGARRCNVHQPA